MKYFILLFLSPVFLLSISSFAQGHGGGHGGGGHSSGHGGSHGGGRVSGSVHTGSRQGATHNVQRSSGGRLAASGAGRSTAINSVSRHMVGRLPAINQLGGNRGSIRNNITPTPGYTTKGTPHGYNPYEHWNAYPYYYYGYYGYNPYYDPYFSMWSFGLNFMYTPHYAAGGSGGSYNDDSYNDQSDNEAMEGFAVYEHDTIAGDITITNSAILLETADTARSYDYKFKIKQRGLQFVSVYDNNDTNSHLDLVRLKTDPKKLYRQVHEGKLNIYDARHGFISRPEDIDVSTIVVVYNGQEESIHSSSTGKTKQWLTDRINAAYNLQLKPKDFRWKELLIYIDKLD